MATHYKINGSTNYWRDTTGWSPSSGGSPGTTYPQSGDNVVFDGSSVQCTNPGSEENSVTDITFSASLTPDIINLGTLNIGGSAQINNSTIMGGYINLVGSAVLSNPTANEIKISGGGVSGSVNEDAGQLVLNSSCDVNCTDVNVSSDSPAPYLYMSSWTVTGSVYSETLGFYCHARVGVADITGSGYITNCLLYSGVTISVSNIILTLGESGAGGCSGEITVDDGVDLTQDAEITSLKLVDAKTSLDSYTNTSGSIVNLTIQSCSDTHTFDLSTLPLTTSINVDGSDKLTLTGDSDIHNATLHNVVLHNVTI